MSQSTDTDPDPVPGPNVVLASDGVPPRRPMLESPVYPARVESGLYDSVATQIQNMGLEAFANLDYPDHFTRVLEEWSGNYRFMDSEGQELRAVLMGEIQNPSQGTCVRAQGNHYAQSGENFQPITDKTKVKDTLALGIPTCATTRIYNTVINQCVPLSNVMMTIADEDSRNGRFPIVKQCTKARKEGSDLHDVVVVTMQPKYNVPSAAGAPAVKRTAKRKLDDTADGSAPVAEPDGTVKFPDPEDIKIGAHYDPHILPDYGGDYFNHQKAKLVQLDVRDIDNSLIPPHKFYDTLKPGTLVLVLASLHCYIMGDRDANGKERKERKIYQLNAHSVRILDHSDEIPEVRTRPIPPDGATRTVAGLPARAISSSFSNFSVPSSPSKSASTPTASPSKSASSKTASGSSSPSVSVPAHDTMDVEDSGEGHLDEPVDEPVEESVKGKGKKRRHN